MKNCDTNAKVYKWMKPHDLTIQTVSPFFKFDHMHEATNKALFSSATFTQIFNSQLLLPFDRGKTKN